MTGQRPASAARVHVPGPLPLAGAANVRDLGGLPVTGGTVATATVLRGDALSTLTDGDLAQLTALGVGDVVDLRSEAEVAAHGADRIPAGARHHLIPLLDDTTAALSAALSTALSTGDTPALTALLGEGRAEAIALAGPRRQLGSPVARAGYARLLTLIARAPGALLFHCTAGKDRTGVAAALLLGLLGADEDTIVADYLASNTANRARNAGVYARLSARGVDPDLVRPLTEQHPQEILGAVATVADHGGWQAYARGALGLGDQVLTALRARLII